jgi:segregation and condensation protein B
MRGLAEQLRALSAVDRSPWRRAQSLVGAGGSRRHWQFLGRETTGELANRRSVARRSRLEAALLLAREPLSLRKLAQLANLADATEARTLLSDLARRYDERGCAFQVAQLAGGYQVLTRREFATWLRPQAVVEGEIRLSSPALETLVVVAYRQPVLRAEVEAIRGVACGEILRQLMDRDLLRIVGRSEELGRPLRYGTTKRFLQVFGLSNLDELPWAQQLRRNSTVVDSGTETVPHLADSGAGLTADEKAA